MKKLLFVTTRRFWPVDSGRKLTLYHYCRGLYEVYGYEIYVYSFLEAGQTPENAEPTPCFIKEITYSNKIGSVEKIKNIISKSIFRKDKFPFQCSLFYSKNNVIAISEFADKIKPDIVIVDMVRLAPYYDSFRNINCKKILDMDDVLSLRYERQAQNKMSEANFLGNYGKEVSSGINRILNLRIFRNAFLKFESKLMKKAEEKYTHLYDNVILVSEKEAEYINTMTNTNKAIAIPVGVDYKYLSEDIGKTSANSTVSFMGNLNVAANVDSLDIIIRKILPVIESKVKLTVIGTCSEEIKSKYKDVINVEFTGRVDDFRPYIKSSKIFLSPIAYGSGIKTKILEAMAMGMPVVTNSIGAEGLDVKDGRELIVKDDYTEIVSAVKELLNNEMLRKDLGERGQKFVQQYHDWDCVYKVFAEIGL